MVQKLNAQLVCFALAEYPSPQEMLPSFPGRYMAPIGGFEFELLQLTVA